MLSRWFEDTVSALAYAIIGAHHGPGFSALHNEVARFVVAQHGRTPDYLRLPLLVATMAFDLAAVPLTGHRFHRLAPERRQRQIAAWARAPLGPCRDLVRFYETLVVFGWISMGGHEV